MPEANRRRTDRAGKGGVSGAVVSPGIRFAGFTAIALLCTLAPLAAQEIELNVIERSLKNGMKVLMVERHQSPTVALHLRFRVGGVDDPKGRTGIAHFLEHMMFKGTKTYGTTNYNAEAPVMEKIDRIYEELDRERQGSNSASQKPDETKIGELEKQMAALEEEQKKYVVSDELWQTYQRLGGVGLNASTGDDSTQYFVQLPSNQLEVWAYLESDRLANPVFREFYPERDVVHEERRMRTDTQPEGLLWENFMAAAFHAHPYRNPVIGWPSDIDNFKREEVLEYFKTFYAPNNAIAAIVGDIDPDKTMALLEKYFGAIPPHTQPRRYISEEPQQHGERRVSVTQDAQPRLVIGYHIPQIGHDDTFALDVLAQVLGGVSPSSRTGRFYQSLVLEKKVALDVDAGAYTSQYPHLFVISATPAQGKAIQEVEQAIYAEIENIQKVPPTDEELTRVRNAVDASLLRALRSNNGVARIIASTEHLAGTWRYLFTEREKTKAVTAEDVQRVGKQYFSEENRTVGELRSKGAATEEPRSAAPEP
ncbi:MAG: insulinase family protein [Acidobacteria bacterium]|nr:insulinase family protein [Acidobacteriota bacterium]